MLASSMSSLEPLRGKMMVNDTEKCPVRETVPEVFPHLLVRSCAKIISV